MLRGLLDGGPLLAKVRSRYTLWTILGFMDLYPFPLVSYHLFIFAFDIGISEYSWS